MITIFSHEGKPFTLTAETFKASFIGKWFTEHYKRRQAASGTLAVAKQMKKQGFPIEIALAVLANKY